MLTLFLKGVFMVKENKNQIFNDYNSKQEIVSITYEEIGFFPRSFSRVLDRFLKQVFSDVDNLVIQEYRFYRYLFLTTLKCLLILFFVPFLVNFFAKNYLVRPLTEYFWNTQQNEIFLNSYQQKRAFSELKNFEEKIYFESLINAGNNQSSSVESPLGLDIKSAKNSYKVNNQPLNESQSVQINDVTASEWTTSQPSTGLSIQGLGLGLGLSPTGLSGKSISETSPNLSKVNATSKILDQNPRKHKREFIIHDWKSVTTDSQSSVLGRLTIQSHAEQQRLQEKTIELALRYNNQSIEAITNFFADLISFITLCYLLFALEIQINITKSFLLECFFGLDDSKKSLLILLITDLLVGYHSSNLWELFFEFLFTHYGLPESQTGIFLLVATLPVLIDVLFKYLIFRHLNRSSPATVATYRAMIE